MTGGTKEGACKGIRILKKVRGVFMGIFTWLELGLKNS